MPPAPTLTLTGAPAMTIYCPLAEALGIDPGGVSILDIVDDFSDAYNIPVSGYKLGPHLPETIKLMSQNRKGKGLRKGLVTVRDKNGKCFLVDKNDGRFLSGEIVSANVGCKKPFEEKTKEKFKKIAADRKVYHCKCCDVYIKGEANWDRHLRSRKHLSHKD